jgi:hypothetical protein
MAFQTDKLKTAPTPEAAGATHPYQAVARDRRVDRTEDLNEEIAAVEASEMEPGFEYLDAELASVVEVGVDFARKLRARGDAARARPADKAFRAACSTIPDRDRAHPRIAGAKIDRKGRGLCLPEGQSASAWRALRSIWCPDDTMSGLPDGQNR